MSKRQQAIKLAAAANVGPDTAMRWLDGGKARSLSTHLALEAAAKKLKIERGPERATQSTQPERAA